jgi:VanZ family protein
MPNNTQGGARAGGKSSLLRTFFPAPFLGATAAYCALIYYLSSTPSFPFPPPFPFADKIAHFFLFGGLSAIVAAGLQRAGREYSPVMLFAIPVAFVFFYGLSDETHQLFVAQRTFEVADLGADIVGASAAAAGFLLFVWKRKNGRGKGGSK